MQTTFKKLPIEALRPGYYQPRKTFDQNGLEELAASIRAQGLIEPIIVRTISKQTDSLKDEGREYEIIAGERRWRAAKLAGLEQVPCIISDYSDIQTAAITLIENIQREDLNAIEEAEAYQRLQNEFNFSHDDIATLVCKSRSHITNILRLLTLSPPIQEKLKNKILTLGHARALIGLSMNDQLYFAKQIEKFHWSVRKIEEEIKKLKNEDQQVTKDQDVYYLENKLSEQIGAPVQITAEKEGGWLKIKFFNNDTLTGLLDRMGLNYDERDFS